jgi:ribA/ribD-fused uncharacterized protein
MNKKITNLRQYYIDECVSFRKTNEEFGGLSNMASGYPIVVNNIYIRTSEALYQAMRFPNHPEIQKEIIEQKSPMTAKMISKKYRKENNRIDWDFKRIAIMRWCLRVKLIQNQNTFGELLLKTNDKDIVEESKRDQFWGAKKIDYEILEGINTLGRLLMELREIYKNYKLDKIIPLNIVDFKLYGNLIQDIVAIEDKEIFKEKDKNSLFQ